MSLWFLTNNATVYVTSWRTYFCRHHIGWKYCNRHWDRFIYQYNSMHCGNSWRKLKSLVSFSLKKPCVLHGSLVVGSLWVFEKYLQPVWSTCWHQSYCNLPKKKKKKVWMCAGQQLSKCCESFCRKWSLCDVWKVSFSLVQSGFG